MLVTEIVFFASGALCVVGGLALSARAPRRGLWWVPAALSAVFLAASAVTIAREGLTGFYPVHSRSLWGNQVWVDLLLAAGTAFAFIAPRGRAVGMNLPIWFLVIVSSGSIGLLAMVARLVWLEDRAAGSPARA